MTKKAIKKIHPVTLILFLRCITKRKNRKRVFFITFLHSFPLFVRIENRVGTRLIAFSLSLKPIYSYIPGPSTHSVFFAFE